MKQKLLCLRTSSAKDEGGSEIVSDVNEKFNSDSGGAIDFDGFLKTVNNLGKYQLIQWSLLFLTTIPQAWYSYVPAFTAMKVPVSQVSCTSGNLTELCKEINGTSCTSRVYHARYTSIYSEFDMICDSSIKIPMTKSIFYIGKFFGAYIFGWFSDRYGRLMALLVSAAIQFVISLATTFSTNYYVFAILRFPMGICSGGNFMAAFLLVTEIAGPNRRNLANAVIQSGYGVGIATQAVIAFLLPKWQHHNLAITIPNIIFVSYIWLTPESPRWQLAKGKREKSAATLRKLAKVNKRDFSDDLWRNVKQAEKQDNQQKYNIFHLFKTPYLSKITLIEAYSWCVVVMVFYGLGFNAGNLSGNIYVNFAAVGLVEIPAYFMAAFLVNKIGRRIPACLYFGIGGLALLAVIPILATGKERELEKLVLSLSLIGKFSLSACFYQVYIHTAELYPTVIRNVGLGVASATGRIGGILAPIITDELPASATPAIFGVTSLIAAALQLMLPETKGHPLPEAFEDEPGKINEKQRKELQHDVEKVPLSEKL